jgi:MutS domain V
VLDLLRRRQAELRESINSRDRGSNKQLEELVQDMEQKEKDILHGLVLVIAPALEAIDRGLNGMALLDTYFARAAYGVKHGGQVPLVLNEGRIRVSNFLHPLLLPSSPQRQSAVPIDLKLAINASSADGSPKAARCLIISGPNGGGKTLALKSFGVAAALGRIGVPIPTGSSTGVQRIRPRVDYFDCILVWVGDQQNVLEGESTFTAKLNAYSRLIENLSSMQWQDSGTASHHLVLLDELGSGTDALSGGAIGQAILEQILDASPAARLVVSTHSYRLKEASLEGGNYECASVQLRTSADYHMCRPTYELLYGVVGESWALSAAARCSPSLPERVLSRAANLTMSTKSLDKMESGLNDDDRSSRYLELLLRSLEEQANWAEEARRDAELYRHHSAQCQRVMASLAEAYDARLSRIEDRLDAEYESLRLDKSRSPLEIVGATVAALQVVRKGLKSQSERLREKGLVLIPPWYRLSKGEQVTVVDEGSEYDGLTGTVVLPEVPRQLNPDEVMVAGLSPWGLFNESDSEEVAATNGFRRFQLAIWDSDRSFEDCAPLNVPPTRSVDEAKRRLNDILLTVRETAVDRGIGLKQRSPRALNPESGGQRRVVSSRQRKAARRKAKG